MMQLTVSSESGLFHNLEIFASPLFISIISNENGNEDIGFLRNMFIL